MSTRTITLVEQNDESTDKTSSEMLFRCIEEVVQNGIEHPRQHTCNITSEATTDNVEKENLTAPQLIASPLLSGEEDNDSYFVGSAHGLPCDLVLSPDGEEQPSPRDVLLFSTDCGNELDQVVPKLTHRNAFSLSEWPKDAYRLEPLLVDKDEDSAILFPPKPKDLHRRRANTASDVTPMQPVHASELDYLRGMLRFKLEKYGEEDPKVGVMWNKLGNSYFRCRKHEEALAAYKQAVKCDGGNHDFASYYIPVAAAIQNLATLQWTTGDTNQAIECLENALHMHEFAAKSTKKDGNSYNNLAVAKCLYQVGLARCITRQYQQAIHDLKRARTIQESLLGEHHLDVARTIDAIGKCYLFLGRFHIAMDCHRQALRIKKSTAGSRTPTVWISLMNIAAVHRANKEYKRAIEIYQEVLYFQQAELAKCKTEITNAVSCAVRIAIETGETYELLADAYMREGGNNEAAINRAWDEALLVYREANQDKKILLLEMKRKASR